MAQPTWRQRLYYYSLFVPVRLYLLFFAAAALLAWWWLQRQQPPEPSLAGSLLSLLVQAGLAAISILLGLALLTVLVPFALFAWQLRIRQVQVQLDNAELTEANQAGRRINMDISPLYRPLLGFLRFRFIYDDVKLSPKFQLIKRQQGAAWFSGRQSGWYRWPLPAIREYEVQQMLVYFEDYFQFFSFSLRLPVKQSFFTRPLPAALPEQQVSPQRTEEENVRIEELKRIEGEYLNYKNFEDNDDVRRIVWKIYARNKELVVRVPEVLDPFASHIYLYTSFYDSLHMPDNYLVNTRGLDFFKNACYSIYQQLTKAGRAVKMIADQPLPHRHLNNATEQAEYQLAASNWQHTYDLLSAVPAKGSAVVCIHSLSSAEQLDQLLQRDQQRCTVVMVRLTQALRRNWLGNWLKWIFIIPKNDFEKQGFSELSRFQTGRALRANEQTLEEVLRRHDATVVRVG